MPEKTPNEIKKGLEMYLGHSEEECAYMCRDSECPYKELPAPNGGSCGDLIRSDALAYIQQLEEDNAKKHEKIMQLNIALEDMQDIVQSITQDSKTIFQQLETKCHQLERERDALLKDIESVQGCICIICKNYNNPNPGTGTAECNILGRFKDRGSDGALMCGQFKWRGVKEE